MKKCLPKLHLILKQKAFQLYERLYLVSARKITIYYSGLHRQNLEPVTKGY